LDLGELMANFQDIVGLRLGRAQLTTSYATVYTCPADKRAYIKDINLCNAHSGNSDASVAIVPTGQTAGVAFEIFSEFQMNANTTHRWTGLQIMNAGDTIQVKGSDANHITVYISGAEAV
jgi:hypothetical protein